jgi:hypothetical protein
MARRGWQEVGAVVMFVVCVGAQPAAAINHMIKLDEVLASWQGDDTVQFIGLRMLAPGQGALSDGGGVRGAADLVFDDATASADGRRIFTFTHDLTRAEAGARILVATRALATLASLEPDFVLEPGVFSARGGRVCYRVNPPQDPNQSAGVIDCVAWGNFSGDTGSFGAPTAATPDNRSLQRVDTTGTTRKDFMGVLVPTPENNAGLGTQLPTLCGNSQINQGEQCDGTALGGQTCATRAFASGTLKCRQCHFDTSGCTFCGNGVVNGTEQCDGMDLRQKSCLGLGFTGGTLACTPSCRLSTAGCDATFFVPGGGPPGPECLAEWRVTNATGQGRPSTDGHTPVRQPCKDGDPGCDADTTTGTCTFPVAVCTNRADPRLTRGGRACRLAPIESWTLLAPTATKGGADADVATVLVSAVAALGPSAVAGGAVSFAPALDQSAHCTGPVTIVVPTRGARPGVRVLRARAAASGGRPRDVDALKLVCIP